MDIQAANHVLTKAILTIEEQELPWLLEFAVPSPLEVHKKTGMPLPKGMMPKKPRKPRKPRAKKEQPKATVAFWSTYLVHKLTRYDMQVSKREAKRGHVNIYRMGHLLAAAQKVDKAVKSVENSDDPKDIKRFEAAMNREFERDFPPIKAVRKALDKYRSTGKRPKIGK
jgi:hypothetical protein